jgi:two-component system, NarL family, nitrate/nitrite response regulator NarL
MSVAVVSENFVFAEILASACTNRGIKVVGVFSSCDSISWIHPDEVVLFHMSSDDPGFPAQIRHLIARFGDLRIILLASDRVSEATKRAMEPLVAAVLPESEPSNALLSAIVLGELGYRVLPHLARPGQDIIVPAPSPDTDLSDHASTILSRREATILRLLHEGLANKVIAKQLGISDTTVKVHLRAAYRKIGVTNRTQAAMWAMRNLLPAGMNGMGRMASGTEH